jgi:ribosomal protein L37AE/L43A
MFAKVCHKCHKESYSSSNDGTWICPYCGEDITSVPSIEPICGRRKCNEQEDK